MSDAEDLRAMVEELKAAYEAQKQRLADDGFPDPLKVVDHTGRPILLDALAALVTAQTALAGAP